MEIDLSKALEYKNYLYKYVQINCIKKKQSKGWVKTLDPLNGNIILAALNKKKSKVIHFELVCGESYSSIDVLESDDEVLNLIKNASLSSNVPILDVTEVKNRLINWIKLHRLPVRENDDGSLEVCDSGTIKPPYRPEDCICSNGRVLSRITDMIRNMPYEEVSSIEGIELEKAS